MTIVRRKWVSSMRVNTNLDMIRGLRHLGEHVRNLETSLSRLSSGVRINRAKDDAAGLAVSTKLSAQVRGSSQARHNVQDAINVVQTIDGALQKITETMQRMRVLLVQAATDTLTDEDRAAVQNEIAAIRREIDTIATGTEFNRIKLLDGTPVQAGTLPGGAATDMRIQTGANSGEYVDLQLVDARAAALGVGGVDASTLESASGGIATLDAALSRVAGHLARFGAYANALGHIDRNLGVMGENMAASESRLRDADMAHESTAATRNMLLMDSSHAMLAQANFRPQQVIALLQTG